MAGRLIYRPGADRGDLWPSKRAEGEAPKQQQQQQKKRTEKKGEQEEEEWPQRRR